MPAPTPKTDLEKYEKALRDSIAAGDSDIFGNSGPEHAAIILKVFCETALFSVRIYCGKLSRAVYSTLGPTLQAAAERGVNIQVLITAETAESRQTAETLKTLGAIHRIDPEEAHKLPHFAVADSIMYRVETDAVNTRAFACTNAKDRSSQALIGDMEDAFAYLWGRSTALV